MLRVRFRSACWVFTVSDILFHTHLHRKTGLFASSRGRFVVRNGRVRELVNRVEARRKRSVRQLLATIVSVTGSCPGDAARRCRCPGKVQVHGNRFTATGSR